jgi:opacity protein-like surface antigen
MSLGVGGNVALPMGSFGDVASIGFGGGAKFEYELQPKLYLTASGQYLMFSAKDDIVGVDWSIIPILAGAKYFFSPGVYGMAELGMNFWSTTYKTPEIKVGNVVVVPAQEVSGSGSDFGFAFGGGYELAMGKSGALDLSVKYQQYASSTGAINFGVAYKFAL